MRKFLLCVLAAMNATLAGGCSTPVCVFANPNLRFGPGTQTSVNAQGLFIQPFYYSQIANTWYKLTYSNYPLDVAIGSGVGGPNWSGASIVDLYSLTPSDATTDYSQYVASSSGGGITTGYGVIVATRVFTINGQLITFRNRFSLGANDTFVKVTTSVTNNATGAINNMLIWVGTRDDYVGLTDVNVKTRGNLIGGQFVAVTANNQSSYAIMITNPTEGVLFYSETAGVMTAYALCCQFANVYNTYPLALAPATSGSGTDGSYAAVLPIGNLSAGATSSITWYYAAGAISSLSAVVEEVAEAQIAEASPSGTAAVTVGATVGSTADATESMTMSATMTGDITPFPTNLATIPLTISGTQSSRVTLFGTPSRTMPLSNVGTAGTSVLATLLASTSNTPSYYPSELSVLNISIQDVKTVGLSVGLGIIGVIAVLLCMLYCIQRPRRQIIACPYCSEGCRPKKLQEHLDVCEEHLKRFVRIEEKLAEVVNAEEGSNVAEVIPVVEEVIVEDKDKKE